MNGSDPGTRMSFRTAVAAPPSATGIGFDSRCRHARGSRRALKCSLPPPPVSLAHGPGSAKQVGRANFRGGGCSGKQLRGATGSGGGATTWGARVRRPCRCAVASQLLIRRRCALRGPGQKALGVGGGTNRGVGSGVGDGGDQPWGRPGAAGTPRGGRWRQGPCQWWVVIQNGGSGQASF